jgi:hypothetical protein
MTRVMFSTQSPYFRVSPRSPCSVSNPVSESSGLELVPALSPCSERLTTYPVRPVTSVLQCKSYAQQPTHTACRAKEKAIYCARK